MNIRNVINKLGLKERLTILMVSISLISTITIGAIAYFKSSQSLEKKTEQQLNSLGSISKQRLEKFFDKTYKNSQSLLTNRLLEGLLIAFEGGFYGSGYETGTDLKIDNDIYYKLDKKYDKRPQRMAKLYDLENIALTTLDGQVIYTTKSDKNGDLLGRNILSGKYAKSGLSSCVTSATQATTSKLFFSRYHINPVTGQVNAFLCGKIFAEFDYLADGISSGDEIGVLVSEINLTLVNKILSQRDGMGETGHAYIIASNKQLRSDFYTDIENFNTKKTLTENIIIESDSINRAYEGKTGIGVVTDPSGNQSLSYYSPVSIFGENWIIIVEKTMHEILAPVREMVLYIVGAIVIVFVLIAIVSLAASNIIVTPIVNAANTLKGIVESVGENSKDMSSASTKLSSGSTKIASSTQETAATLDELSAMIQKNLNSVKATTVTASRCEEMATSGREQVTQMIDAVKDIDESNDDMIEAMTEINGQMHEFMNVISEISEKTKLIDDIVFQTKLLSFNASVEAARAGEHGKGFSIVAEEVGHLAQESGNASNQISTIISNSISKVEEVVNDASSKIETIKKVGKDKITVGIDKAHECDKSLDDILLNVQDVSQEVSSITTSSTEQAHGISEVSSSITLLDEAAHDTSTLSESSLDIAKKLSTSSTKLEDIAKDLSKLIYGAQFETMKEAKENPVPGSADILKFKKNGDDTNKGKLKNIKKHG